MKKKTVKKKKIKNAKDEKTIARLQPKERSNGVLPYPYFIKSDALVGRQDFWKGKPFKLLGFSKIPEPGDIDLMFSDFKKNTSKAIGMYPVFANEDSNWVTYSERIESV